MLKKFKENVLNNYLPVTILLSIITVVIPVKQYLINSYNNYTIFQHSANHFFQKVNPYIEYPHEYRDLFLYNPSFSVLFIPFAYLPTLLGMFLWVTLTIGVFYYAVRLLPMDKKSILFILYFTFLEIISTALNMQTNLLIVSGIMLTFIFLEKGSCAKSSFFVNLGFFIKAYGIISGIFIILKRPQLKSFLYLLLWFLLLFCLPLVYYTPGEFIILYRQWFNCLLQHHEINMGLSVMSFIEGLFHLNLSVYYVQLFGVFLLLVTILIIALKKIYEDVKFFFLAYILIWVIIFNQAAENATYITAVTGSAIWYVNSKKTFLDKTLIIITFILTVLSPSDLFPGYLRNHFVKPYSLRVLGPMAIFLKIQISILFDHVKFGHNNSAVQPS